ncbi:MAG TPA: subclass B3 metallo-beta-lactamase [Sphingomicrobium sp.]|nr:subclass B3 metallo-beta-lactamase [Sphingomicrobium sp.]
MFVKAALGPAALAAAQLVIPLGHPRVIEPPKAPIETAGPLWVARCNGSKDYAKAAPPVRIHGNTFLVGTCGISSILIVGDQGDILIDAGPQEAAPLIAANVEALGFHVQDIRYILNSHEHPDHIGGVAELQRMSRATLVTSARAARVFETGRANDDDPQAGTLKAVPTATVGRIIGDGEQLRLGNLMLTALATPGHTPGALSWRWVSCDGGVCRTIVYADSLSPVSAPNYRYSDHPAYLAAYRASIAKISSSPCEILLTPHPEASDLPGRLALGEPLFDPNACKNYAATLSRNLDDRLAKEARK